METNDKIGLSLLVLILIATIAVATPNNRIVFEYILVFYTIVYLLNRFHGKREEGRREVEEQIHNAETQKELQKAYWSGGEEKPGGGDTI